MSGSWPWPLHPDRLGPYFGETGHLWVPYHHGQDMIVSVGTPVHSPAAGTVASAGFVGGSYGNLLTISHGNGVWTAYGHISAFRVSTGDRVAAGDVVALSGGQPGAYGAGNSTAPHLHFEVRTGGDSVSDAVNPMPYLTSTFTALGGGAGTPEADMDDAQNAWLRDLYRIEAGDGSDKTIRTTVQRLLEDYKLTVDAKPISVADVIVAIYTRIESLATRIEELAQPCPSSTSPAATGAPGAAAPPAATSAGASSGTGTGA